MGGLKSRNLFSRLNVPMTDRSIITGRKGKGRRGKRRPTGRNVCALEGGQLCTGLDVPPAHGEVGVWRIRGLALSPACGEDVAPVGRKGHAADEVLVPLEAAQLFACLKIPQDHDSAPTRPRQACTSGAQIAQQKRESVCRSQAADFLPALHVPHDQVSITMSGDGELPVGRKGNARYPSDLSLEAVQLLPRSDFPQP